MTEFLSCPSLPLWLVGLLPAQPLTITESLPGPLFQGLDGAPPSSCITVYFCPENHDRVASKDVHTHSTTPPVALLSVKDLAKNNYRR